MVHKASDLEAIFRSCFFDDYATVLVGGGDEPLYLPAEEPGSGPHRIVYREDFFASALHEVAHWCVAGRERRLLEDYGYWYSPDGRSAEQQAEFERVEARPQAIESLFAEACRSEFHLSADNLEGGVGAGEGFARAVDEWRSRFSNGGLPARAARFHEALVAHYGGLAPR